MKSSIKTYSALAGASLFNGLLLGFFIFFLLAIMNPYLVRNVSGLAVIYGVLGPLYYGPLCLVIFTIACIVFYQPWRQDSPLSFSFIAGCIFLCLLLFLVYAYHSNLTKFESCLSPYAIFALKTMRLIFFLSAGLIFFSLELFHTGKIPAAMYRIFLFVLLVLLICACSGFLLRLPVDLVWEPDSSGTAIGEEELIPVEDAGADTRIILLGFDGMTWDVIHALLEQGRLPHFKRAIREGVHGNLKTHLPTLSPVIWSTIATGITPYKHGMLDFEIWRLKGLDDRIRLLPVRCFLTKLRLPALIKSDPYTIEYRRSPAVWEILTHYYRRSTGVVNWFPSIPAELTKGFQVSNYFHYDYENSGRATLIEDIIYPFTLFETLSDFRMDKTKARAEALSVLTRVPEEDRARPVFYDRVFSVIYEETVTYDNAARYTYRKYKPDFYAYYSNATDAAAHLYWQFYKPEDFFHVDPEAVKTLGSIVPEYYGMADRMLGEFMEMADENTVIMVLSDHGMHTAPFFQRLYFKYWQGREVSASHVDAPDGIFIVTGTGIKKNEKITSASVYDVAPTILHTMGCAVSQEFSGKVLQSIYTHPRNVRIIPKYSRIHHKHIDEYKFSPQHRRKLEMLKGLGYIVGE